MKRHENLYSAFISFGAALAFLIFGIVVTVVLKPFLEDASAGYRVFALVPAALYAIAAVLAVVGVYSVINDRLVETGSVIEADVTGIKEYFTGKSTEIVHYNLFCEAVINGRKYKFSKKNIGFNPKDNIHNNKVNVKINSKNPMQYYVML